MSKRIPNTQVITQMKEALAAMEIKGVNFFRVRAYQNTISILDNLTVSIHDLWENKKLRGIPGVGAGIQEHLNELFEAGKVKEWEALKKDLPDGMFILLSLRGIGAKKAFKLAKAFKINSRKDALKKLKENAQKNKIRDLPGFGEKSELDILESIENSKISKNQKKRMLYVKAEQIVERIKTYLIESEHVEEVVVCGSYRRKNPTIGDLDIPIATINPKEVIEYFCKFEEIGDIVTRGEKRATVVLKNDVQVDIYASDPEAFGAMVQYFTGNKQHNIMLRTYALTKGRSLSEYGIKKNGKVHKFADEESFYKEIGLPYIEPELRNGNYEIEVARKNKLPKLVALEDIKGDLHCHTVASDGKNTLEEMVQGAMDLGYEYLGVSDHSPSVKTRGLKGVERLMKKQRALINEINKVQKKVKVLFGYEVNILADSSLGLPNELLKELDYVIASIHSAMNHSGEEVTRRLVSAIENPYVDIIGHPSSRIINERDPVDPNWDRVFAAALDNNKILEINAEPDRLDLPDDLIKEAIDKGVKLAINSDAHELSQQKYMKYGIFNARRGWCESKDIINTLSLAEVEKIFLK